MLARVRMSEGFDTEIEPWLEVLRASALWTAPHSLTEQVCRDPKDDKFIAAALASGARTLITRDAGLTVLEKPFGIEVLTPRPGGRGFPEYNGAC